MENLEKANEILGFNFKSKKIETAGYIYTILEVKDVNTVNSWCLLALMDYVKIKRNWIGINSIEVFELVNQRIRKC